MIFLEATLITVLFILFIDASLSDFKNGIIKNSSIALALGTGLIVTVVYYAFFAKDCFISFIINVAMGLFISLLLYAYGIWGAGDSKLLLTTILLFPARLYCMGNRSLASCFLLISIIFIVAFIYIVFDTLIMGIKQKNLFKIHFQRIKWKEFIKNFLFIFLSLNLANCIIGAILPKSFLNDTMFLAFIHFALVLIAMYVTNKVNWIIVAIIGAIWIISMFVELVRFELSGINYASYIVIIVLMLFRSSSNKYNYKTIKTTDLQPGMILSIGSVIMLSNSRIKGLPVSTTEDLKSRLSVQEVESIYRWAASKQGKESIVIVRKIPFAFFIAIGTLIYFVLEVVSV